MWYEQIWVHEIPDIFGYLVFFIVFKTLGEIPVISGYLV